MAVKEQQQQQQQPAAVPVIATTSTTTAAPQFTGAVIGGPPPPPGPPKPVGNNKKALWSLVCSIVGLFFLGIVLGPVAIFLGVQAKQEIKASSSSAGGGQIKGDGMATAGIVIGVIAFVGSIIVIAMLA